jgi:hypothetical protein
MELQELPNELLLEIVSLIDHQSALRLRATNKRFKPIDLISTLRFSTIVNKYNDKKLNYDSEFYIHYDDINDESMTYLMENYLFNPSYNKIISYNQSSKLTSEIKQKILDCYIYNNRPNLIELLLDADNEIHITEQNVLDAIIGPEDITYEVQKVIFDRMTFTDIDLIRMLNIVRDKDYMCYGTKKFENEDESTNYIYKLFMKRGLNVKQVFFRFNWHEHSLEICQLFIDQGCFIEFDMVKKAAESSYDSPPYEYLVFALDNADQNFINEYIKMEVVTNSNFTDEQIFEFLLRSS